mmetsp:Transcript_40290/g.49084  ORF Transcript_40290/g.49084 Transcript_40290/m.49084 type:complete len:286 (+) Transcript_40290:66-923(+)
MTTTNGFGTKTTLFCIITYFIAITADVTTAFNSHRLPTCPKITTPSFSQPRTHTSPHRSRTSTHLHSLQSWWNSLISSTLSDVKQPKSNTNANTSPKKKHTKGTVIRTAARSYRGQDSAPQGRGYTTSKESLQSVTILSSGIVGDYNHYRTKALSSTPDRAVSILTTDVHKTLLSSGGYTQRIQYGDLGENLLVDGIDFTFFRVGGVYHLGTDVTVQITEPIEPCANLCKLEFINDVALQPKDRVKRCQEFLNRLAVRDGFRGWYAKVVGAGGDVAVGDEVSAVA